MHYSLYKANSATSISARNTGALVCENQFRQLGNIAQTSIVSAKTAAAKLSTSSSLGTLAQKLSTYVDSIVWIAVNNLCINGLGDSTVDKADFCSKVIHRLSTSSAVAKTLCGQAQKKILDQLSPYPQSLLLTLNYKISL